MKKFLLLVAVLLSFLGTAGAITLDHHNATGWDYASVFGTVGGAPGSGAYTIIVYGTQTLPTSSAKAAWATWYFNNGVCVTTSGGSTPATNRRGMSIVYGTSAPGNVNFTIKVGAAAEVAAGSLQWSGQLSQPGSAIERGPHEMTFDATPPVLNPQPWVINYTNQDSQAHSYSIVAPNGQTVKDGSFPPNSAGSQSWTPFSNDPAGVYKLYVAGSSVNGSIPVQVHSGSNTLTATPGGPSWSKTWATTPTAVSIAANTSTPGDTDATNRGLLENKTGGAMTTTWTDEAGNVTAGPSIPAGGKVSVDASNLPVPGSGQTQNYTLKDNTGKVLGQVSIYNPGDSGQPKYSGSANAVWNPVVAVGTPTTASTNLGNQTTGTATGSAPGTTVVNNANTTISGTGTGATNQDIYNDVFRALEDSGAVLAAPVVGRVAPQATDIAARGKIDLIAGELDATLGKVDTAKAGIMAKVASVGNLSWVPTSGIGSVTYMDFGTFSIANQTVQIRCDFAPMASIISLIRGTILFAMAIAWTLLVVRTIRSYL